jgi:hypothetical protein
MISKYLLLLVALLVMVVGVQGLALTFQQPEDFSTQIINVGGTSTWVENTTGGNSYWTQGGTSGIYFMSATPLPSTYSAITIIGGTGASAIKFFDSAFTNTEWFLISAPSGSRTEIKIIGGTIHAYNDGVEFIIDTWYVGDANISQNPSYIAWGTPGDDVIWGSTESRYIFGMPDQGYWTGKQYFLMKDILNPAASGFYRRNTTDPTGTPTLIASYSMETTFGKNGGTNETVTLHSPTGGTGGTYYTGTAYAGQIQWNLTEFFASSAGYGLYQTDINPQTSSPGFATSEWIPYIGSGASIQFDKNSYAVGETATATVIISDGYYDLATYSYHVVIQDIYGTEVYDQPISFTASPHTGTATYTWTDAETEGIYYGLIYAKKISDNTELLMNYDTCDLNSVLVINGYVKDAETAGTITGATVNITQGVTTDSVASGADGNYTSISNFVANAPTTIVASMTGYETYQHVFTPLYAGVIQINLTLMPTSPTYTGIALGGIARTPPYNRTIDSATITINKAGIGNYLATTNSAGYYIQNNMPNGTVWDIWGAKSGFSNSTTYQKLVVGI